MWSSPFKNNKEYYQEIKLLASIIAVGLSDKKL